MSPLSLSPRGGSHDTSAARHEPARIPPGPQLWPALLQVLHSDTVGSRSELQAVAEPVEPTWPVAQSEVAVSAEVLERLVALQYVAAEQSVELAEHSWHRVARDKHFGDGSQARFGKLETQLGRDRSSRCQSLRRDASRWPWTSGRRRSTTPGMSTVRFAPVSMSKRIGTGAGTLSPRMTRRRSFVRGNRTRAGRII